MWFLVSLHPFPTPHFRLDSVLKSLAGSSWYKLIRVPMIRLANILLVVVFIHECNPRYQV
jgi:hypothetical protein